MPSSPDSGPIRICDLVLLDQLARRGHRLVGRGVGRALDDLDLLAAGHVVVLLERQLGAADAVLARAPRTAPSRVASTPILIVSSAWAAAAATAISAAALTASSGSSR